MGNNNYSQPFLSVFLQPLFNVTAAPNGPPVTMTCVARAQNLYWFVNNTWYSHKTMDQLLRKGFAFSNCYYNDTLAVVGGSVIVSISVQHRTNNNTVVKCHAQNISTESTTISAATILIAGNNYNYYSSLPHFN